MKTLAILWTADGEPQCKIDTTDPHGIALEGFLEMLQRNFPESGARLAFVTVTETDGERETMPAPDPFSRETLAEAIVLCGRVCDPFMGCSVAHRCELPQGHVGPHKFWHCPQQARAEQPTLDDGRTLEERD